MDVIYTDQEYPVNLVAKIRRISNLLTQQEIATVAGVSGEDVDLFERGQPMKIAARRKLVEAYTFKGTINKYLLNRVYENDFHR